MVPIVELFLNCLGLACKIHRSAVRSDALLASSLATMRAASAALHTFAHETCRAMFGFLSSL